MKEIWKNVVGFEDYQVSSLGNVRNKRGRILKLTVADMGYYVIGIAVYSISSNGHETRKRLFVHRLVAEAFLVNPKNKRVVNHKDGNKLNNSVENLEWATDKENYIHALEKGLIKTEHKLTYEQAQEIKSLCIKGDSLLGIKSLSRKFNVSPTVIQGIVNKKTYLHPF
jgi:hypothetical protein